MIISKKWLSQYMDLSDITMEELADRVTSAGLEVGRFILYVTGKQSGNWGSFKL